MYESFCPSLTLAFTSALQLTLLKSIKTVLSLLLTSTYLQRVPRSNKYVHVGKEFCRLLLMHADSGSSPSPQHYLSIRPFFLIHPPLASTICPSVPSFSFIPLSWTLSVRPSLLFHSSTQLAGRPLQVTSKLLHVICTSRM